MVEQENLPFDSKLINTQHFFETLIRQTEIVLEQHREEEAKEAEELARSRFKRLLNRVMGVVSDNPDLINLLELQVSFYKKIIEKAVQETDYRGAEQFLFASITDLLTRIEKRQKEDGVTVLRWSQVIRPEEVDPTWLLTQGVRLLNQLNPDLGEPLATKTKGLKMNSVYVELS